MHSTLTLKSKDRTYDIVCGSNILSQFSKYFKITAEKICIVTDSNVAKLYLDELKKGLLGYEIVTHIFTAGEKSKNLSTAAKVFDLLAENSFSRSDALIALGGGVAGDLTGFIASTYLRGIKYYSIPTSLLAQVDSSVGGKCAVDIPMGKNLVGTFYQPFGVLADFNTLETLPKRQTLCGLAEVIKYGFIVDKSLAYDCGQARDSDLNDIIVRCIDIKREIVEEDEFDDARRMILNFGHTIGHAIEALGEYKKYSHGEAVAIGMAYAAKISANLKLCTSSTAKEVVKLIKSAGLPINAEYTADQIMPYLLNDKKMRSGSLNFILLEEIGKAVIYPIKKDEVYQIIKAVL